MKWTIRIELTPDGNPPITYEIGTITRPIADLSPEQIGLSSARETSHQRNSILCMRKPPKPPEFRKTKSGGASHLNGARRIGHESSGQPSIEQETADALESRGSALSLAGSRRASKR